VETDETMTSKTMVARKQRWVLRKDMERDAVLRLPRPGRGAVVVVERGVVLVTRKGDLEDHVLQPGMELPLDGHGLVVAWALEPSTLHVRARGSFICALSPDFDDGASMSSQQENKDCVPPPTLWSVQTHSAKLS